MNLKLHPEIEQYVDQQVRAGNFPTAEAVVEDALTRLMAGEAMSEEDRAEIALAEEEFERGEAIEFTDFAARMRAKYGITGHEARV